MSEIGPRSSLSSEHISSTEIKNILRENYEGTRLVFGRNYEISNENPIDSCARPSEGVYQDLRAVISAGKEFFSLIDVFVVDKSGNKRNVKSTVLARHIDGQRAELITAVPRVTQRPLAIGRAHQPGMQFDGTVSGEHFLLYRDDAEDEAVVIADMGSTNGTEIFTSRKEFSKISKQDDPVADKDFWSVESSGIRQFFEPN